MPAKPQAEISADIELVAALIAEQHPDLASLELREVDSGWDNWMFRLGETMAVRLPRRHLAVELLELERSWLPTIARGVSVALPEPLRLGVASERFAWPWSIVRWIPGRSAERAPLASSQAARLGAFMAELHQPAPSSAPHNPYRGVPLRERQSAIEGHLLELQPVAPTLDHDALARVWAAALAAPIDLDSTWLHGDLHPRNVIVDERGELAGIVDWGDLCAGDPACDLAAAWMHFDPEHQGPLWRAYGRRSPATEARARGWALMFGSILAVAGLPDDPAFARAGRRILARLGDC